METHHHDPEYVQGQIIALRSLLLGLAQQIDPVEFREQSLARLEIARTTMLAANVSDLRIQAIDDMDRWVRSVTS